MKATPKTIQIFLPDGNPRGMRVAEITTRIVQVIEVPRHQINDFIKSPESEHVALYFLCGSDDSDEPTVYVGQTGDLRKRLPTHQKKKEFWDRALIVVSKTSSLTQTHALFLEWHCIQQLREAGRYTDQNGNSGTRPHTPAPLEADCMEIFDTTKTLVATLGHPLFEPFPQPDQSNSQDVYFCKRAGAEGKGIYTAEGMVVLKGSRGPKDKSKSLIGHSYEHLRETLVEKGYCEYSGDHFVFLKNCPFSKPSKAAAAIHGSSANGWKEWKTSDGKTLDEMERQN